MKVTWKPLAIAGVLAIAIAGRPAHAQIQYAAPAARTVVVTPGAPVVSGGTYAVLPERRITRQRGRYYTMRPNYGQRPALTFEPYSRYYLNDGRFAARRGVVPQVVVPAYPR